MKKIFLAALMLLALFFPAAKAEPRVLRVGYFAYPGFHEQSEDGHRSGYGYELYQRLARYADVTYEYVGYDCDWNGVQQMLERGEIDVIAGAHKTPMREAVLDFSSRDIGQSFAVLTVSAGNEEIVPGDYATYNGMTVGALRGSESAARLMQFAMEKGFSYTLKQYGTTGEVQQALESGAVQAALNTRMRKMDSEWTLESFEAEPIYFVTRKGDTETKALLEDALEELDRNEVGWRQELRHKYFTETEGRELALTQEQEQYLQAQAQRVYTVSVQKDRYPYAYRDDSGNPTGILIELFDEIASRAGIRFVFSGAEGADIVLDMLNDFSRAEQAGYKLTEAYANVAYAWVMRKGDMGYPQTAAKVSEIDVSGVAQSVLCESTQAALYKVRTGEADGFYTNIYQAEKLVRDNIYNDLKTTSSAGSAGLCFGVKETEDVRLVQILNKAIDSLPDAFGQDIANSYAVLGDDQAFSLMRFVREYPQISLLVIICLALVIWAMALNAHSHMLQKKLRAALRDAQQASRAKTEFLSNMSHDIRTPINGIMGMIDVAQAHLDDRARVENSLKKMKGAARHLNSLINDVLDMSKIESGKMNLESRPVMLPQLLETCCTIAEGQMMGRKLTFIRAFEPLAHPCVMGSELHLRQILINLLSNAVKYTKDGGIITFSAKETGEKDGRVSLRFAVQDTGVGMSEEFMRHIFEPFTQEGHSSRTTYQGTGLGMAITKRLVDQMGGTIDVQSKQGEGSLFVVELSLPIGRQDAQADGGATQDGLTGIRVLLAEDNALNREIAVELLTEAGAEITCAENGQKALELLADESRFDVVLMDVMMPEMDGLAATRTIRRAENGERRIPIIAMTANVFEEDIRRCREAGMDSHVGKPVDIGVLTKEILRLVRRG